jgi:flagellar motility protein MotE (MotC chaperone)
LPMTRVTSIDGGQVIMTGVMNMRRFEQRPAETLVLGELLDRTVTMRDGSGEVVVEDVAMTQLRTRDWVVSKVFVRRAEHHRGLGGRLRRRGESFLIDADQVTGLSIESTGQGAANLLATFGSLKAADIADVIHDLSPKRRVEVAAALDDEKLADVLEELPEDDQVEILGKLDLGRAADVLEEMDPDDAADLLGELPHGQREQLLTLMEPEEAAPVRRLLRYPDDTAGGMMTTDPLILPPDATVAEALAQIRNPDLNPALAAQVYVCRPPGEPPTGRFLGIVHFQRLLRDPPSALIGGLVDTELDPLRPRLSLDAVSSYLATYNLVAVPIVDENGHLLGAVTVDDVLDHLLPEDWRETVMEATVNGTAEEVDQEEAALRDDRADHEGRENRTAADIHDGGGDNGGTATGDSGEGTAR